MCFDIEPTRVINIRDYLVLNELRKKTPNRAAIIVGETYIDDPEKIYLRILRQIMPYRPENVFDSAILPMALSNDIPEAKEQYEKTFRSFSGIYDLNTQKLEIHQE